MPISITVKVVSTDPAIVSTRLAAEFQSEPIIFCSLVEGISIKLPGSARFAYLPFSTYWPIGIGIEIGNEMGENDPSSVGAAMLSAIVMSILSGTLRKSPVTESRGSSPSNFMERELSRESE